jgi:hypothetical protein
MCSFVLCIQLADAYMCALKTYSGGVKKLEGKWDGDARSDIDRTLHSDLSEARSLLWEMEHAEVHILHRLCYLHIQWIIMRKMSELSM